MEGILGNRFNYNDLYILACDVILESLSKLYTTNSTFHKIDYYHHIFRVYKFFVCCGFLFISLENKLITSRYAQQ